jgi:hypothetical protein
MKLEYGPPGASGVKHLQYLSADEPDFVAGNLSRVSRPVAALAAGVWVYALITKREKLRRQALGVSIAAFVVGLVTR